MGATVGPSRRRGGGLSRHRSRPMADINVTPFVDVMLVLLVIFMVTAPLLTVGVTVDLPKTKAGPLQGQDEPLAISVNAEGKIFLQETEVELEALAPRLLAITNNNPEIRIFIRGDRAIAYGQIMQVMGTVNGAGFGNVALVTDRSDKPDAGDKTGKTGKTGKADKTPKRK